MNDETYVRSVWERVYAGAVAMHLSRDSAQVVITSGGDFIDWSAAAEFTRERLEQVRQLREEIAVVQRRKREDALYLAIAAVWDRTLARLESALATLTQGMKPEAQP